MNPPRFKVGDVVNAPAVGATVSPKGVHFPNLDVVYIVRIVEKMLINQGCEWSYQIEDKQGRIFIQREGGLCLAKEEQVESMKTPLFSVGERVIAFPDIETIYTVQSVAENTGRMLNDVNFLSYQLQGHTKDGLKFAHLREDQLFLANPLSQEALNHVARTVVSRPVQYAPFAVSMAMAYLQLQEGPALTIVASAWDRLILISPMLHHILDQRGQVRAWTCGVDMGKPGEVSQTFINGMPLKDAEWKAAIESFAKPIMPNPFPSRIPGEKLS